MKRGDATPYKLRYFMTTVALQALNVLVHNASVAREVHWVAALHCLVRLLRDNVQCDIRSENCGAP